MGRIAPLLAAVFLMGGCETTNSNDWSGGASTPFNQAERSCGVLVEDIENEDGRRDFFIGCMQSLGWSPKPGASIAL